MVNSLTPKQVVKELDKFIIGQDLAKRKVAIALRNRFRRQQVDTKMKDEIMPNNIIMIGPTGVGKTEIARRLAGLTASPFIKAEASKFTEVGYVGRDVESIIRDLMEIAVTMVKKEKRELVKEKALKGAEERLLNILLPQPKKIKKEDPRLRKDLQKRFLEGKLDTAVIEIEKKETFPGITAIPLGIGFESLLQDLGSREHFQTKKVTVYEAFQIFVKEETDKLVDKEKVVEEAKQLTENFGIVFIDEIDKVAGRESKGGPDVSRSGVQRDLLPIIEGSSVMTKYGFVKTDHILFIAAGAFHMSKPSDLLPEMQGRFPIRVQLDNLTEKDFQRILVEPENALTKQYESLFATEKEKITFTKKAICKLAYYAARANEKTENIGARRLQTVMSTLLEDYLFEMPDVIYGEIKITEKNVVSKLKDLIEDENLSKYIL